MSEIRPRDEIEKPPTPCPAETPPAEESCPDAGIHAAAERYRQHLDRFPERGTDSALERAAKALIRIAQIRSKAPPRAE